MDHFLACCAGAQTFLRKLWLLSRPYWFASDKQAINVFGLKLVTSEATIARVLLALVVLLSVFVVYMSKLLNAWNARFFNAIQQKNGTAFWHELKYWGVLVVVFIVAFVYRQWLTLLLGIRWRRWLSEVYFRDWLSDRTYYRMEFVNQGADNPEQRIEQDCNSFVTQTLSIVLGLLLQLMTLATFAVVLWNLSGSFRLGGIAIPGYMMWVAFAYALIGSLVTYLVGRPLVRVNFTLERRNADFRYRMVRIRENAESVALYRGESDEQRRLREAFARIYAIWWDYMTYNKRLTWLTAFYSQAAAVFPVIVVAPRYFSGAIELGTLTQTVDAFTRVQGALSWFVDTYSSLAAWKAVVDRLTTFSEAMAATKTATANNAFHLRMGKGSELCLRNIDVRLPNGKLLLADVNLTLQPGEAVCLHGPSGSGKSTLLRVLAGLWPYGAGSVSLPNSARILFLPQKPYLPLGTIKDVLSYPQHPEAHSTFAYREALRACGLGQLGSRLDDCVNWSLVLSGGEQQRVAFARALLFKPEWLFLDEAASALDETAERRILALLNEHLPGVTIVSITHRQTSLDGRQRRLAIDPTHHRLRDQIRSENKRTAPATL